MAVFENVKIAKKANILYEGHVTSRAIEFEDGTKKTLGVMLPGEYDFTTIHEEVLDIQSGELEVLLPAQDWKKIVSPQSFVVPANSRFKLKVVSLVDYCCSFIKH